MSLDVYLYEVGDANDISEFDYDKEEVYWANITSNLNTMAKEAGIYYQLWRPDELKIVYARELIDSLTKGLQKMKDNPEYYKQFNASNGWGLYEHFIPWIEKYLNACIEYPNAVIAISR